MSGRTLTLHEVGIFVKHMNKRFPNKFSKSYEKLIGVKNIIITRAGVVISLEKGILPTSQTQDGYLTVTLCGHIFLVHRLVALAYCPNASKNYKVVCHKNKNRKDNRASNLMWTNNSYIANRREDGFKKKKENIKRPIRAKDNEGFDKVYPNANVAMKELGVPRGNIYKVCKGERNTAGGYNFSYAVIDEFFEQV